MYTIYLATNQINNKMYVGQTIQELHRRWSCHCNHAKSFVSKSHFAGAIRKHGKDSFVLDVIAKVETKEEADYQEKIWILLLRTFEPQVGYNLTFGGEGARRTTRSIEKQRQTMLGRKATEEARKNQSIGLTKAWADGRMQGGRGRKMSENERATLRSRMTGSGHHYFRHDVLSEQILCLWNLGVRCKDIAARFEIEEGTVRRRILSTGLPYREYHTAEGREKIRRVAKRLPTADLRDNEPINVAS